MRKWDRARLEYRVCRADETYPALAHASILGSGGASVWTHGTAYSEDAGVAEWEFVEGGEVWRGACERECQWR